MQSGFSFATMPHMKQIRIFTDGSSRGNPGPSGWGVVVLYPSGKINEYGGRADVATNNQMELTACLEALRAVEMKPEEADEIVMHLDSAYVLGGVTGWVYSWEKNGWKTSAGEPVQNQDLWKAIAALLFRLKTKHTIVWEKVKGHVGVFGNERVDAIATAYADGTVPLLYSGTKEKYEKLYNNSLENMEHVALPDKKSPPKSTKPAYSYVSMLKSMIEVHKTWDECEARVKGKSGAKFKKVFSKEEEQELIQEWTLMSLIGDR